MSSELIGAGTYAAIVLVLFFIIFIVVGNFLTLHIFKDEDGHHFHDDNILKDFVSFFFSFRYVMCHCARNYITNVLDTFFFFMRFQCK